ncbi:MAG: PorV/PorQ family protein [bacterium]
MLRKSMTYGLLPFLSLFLALPGSAQNLGSVTKVGTTSAGFLEIGVGSRATGMGGAFVAIANDATALYWNPAGITHLQSNEVVLVHTEWLADINFDFAGLVLPVGNFGTLGAMITVLSTDDLPERTIDEPEGTGNFFSVGDLAIGVTYSRKLTDRFAIGATVKYINQRISQMSANGFAIDFGTTFDTGLYGLRIGAALSNFGTDMKLSGKDALVFVDIDPSKSGNNDRVEARLDTDSWPLPLNFQVGVAKDVLSHSNNRLTLAVDFVHPTDNTESLNLGFEYEIWKTVRLRGGYRNLLIDDGEETFTFGGGISTHFLGNVSLKLDYAYADFGRLNNTQRFSLALTF